MGKVESVPLKTRCPNAKCFGKGNCPNDIINWKEPCGHKTLINDQGYMFCAEKCKAPKFVGKSTFNCKNSNHTNGYCKFSYKDFLNEVSLLVDEGTSWHSDPDQKR